MLSTKSGPPKWGPYLCLWVLMMGCICATGTPYCYEPSRWSVTICDFIYKCLHNGTESATCSPYGPSQNFATHTPVFPSCYKLVPSISLDCRYPTAQCCFNDTSDAKCCRYEPGPYHETCHKIKLYSYETDKLFTCPDSYSYSETACCDNNTNIAECCDPSTTTTDITTTTDSPWPTFEPDYDYLSTIRITASVVSLCLFIICLAVGIYIRRRRVTRIRKARVFQQQPGLYPFPNYVYPNQQPPTYSGQVYPYPPPPPGSVYTISAQNQVPPAYATQDPNSQTGIGFDNRSFEPTSSQGPSPTSTSQKS